MGDFVKGCLPHIGGNFGGFTLFSTAMYQEVLDCNSKAHDFTEE